MGVPLYPPWTAYSMVTPVDSAIDLTMSSFINLYSSFLDGVSRLGLDRPGGLSYRISRAALTPSAKTFEIDNMPGAAFVIFVRRSHLPRLIKQSSPFCFSVPPKLQFTVVFHC